MNIDYTAITDSYFFNRDFGVQLFCSFLAFSSALTILYFIKVARGNRLLALVPVQLKKSVKLIVFPLTWSVTQWMLIAFCREYHWEHQFNQVIAEFLTAWIIVRLSSQFINQPTLQKATAIIIYLYTTLDILGLLPHLISIMENLSLSVGDLHLSLLSTVKGGSTLLFLLWATTSVSKWVELGLKKSSKFERSLQELFTKLLRVAFLAFTFIITLSNMGLDLSAFAVFSGAIGVGIGFGLQKVVSNLVCGIILLLDRSIKPGDVVALDGGTSYGEINKLGARYVSVRTRSGKEHLIPNEDFITHKSENWSYSDSLIRLSLPMRAGLDSDVLLVLKLLVDAAEGVARVMTSPVPGARLRSFGDSSINFELRVWIQDPHNGVSKVKSDIYVNIWKLFKEHDITIPHPQRDLHIQPLDDNQPSIDSTKEMENLLLSSPTSYHSVSSS